MWRINPDSVLQGSDHQPFLPGFPRYSLEWCEYRRVVRKNEVCFLLHCLFHHLLSEVVSEEKGVHSVGRTWFHQQSHIVPAFSQSGGCEVIQCRNELPEVHEGAYGWAAQGTDEVERRAEQRRHRQRHAGPVRGKQAAVSPGNPLSKQQPRPLGLWTLRPPTPGTTRYRAPPRPGRPAHTAPQASTKRAELKLHPSSRGTADPQSPAAQAFRPRRPRGAAGPAAHSPPAGAAPALRGGTCARPRRFRRAQRGWGGPSVAPGESWGPRESSRFSPAGAGSASAPAGSGVLRARRAAVPPVEEPSCSVRGISVAVPGQGGSGSSGCRGWRGAGTGGLRWGHGAGASPARAGYRGPIAA